MHSLTFSSKIFKLGINPCVEVPENVLNEIFRQAGKEKGPIPVRGTLNGISFKQTLVKYQGIWRLYINTQMRRDAGIDVGDEANVEIIFDPKSRIEPMNQEFALALSKNNKAKEAFEKLTPSHQKEILRYLNYLKNQESLVRNVEKVIQYLVSKKLKSSKEFASKEYNNPNR